MSDILSRMGNILRANINDMLDGAEDPEKMIDQLVRDYSNEHRGGRDCRRPDRR